MPNQNDVILQQQCRYKYRPLFEGWLRAGHQIGIFENCNAMSKDVGSALGSVLKSDERWKIGDGKPDQFGFGRIDYLLVGIYNDAELALDALYPLTVKEAS
jgi:hypothetical protein